MVVKITDNVWLLESVVGGQCYIVQAKDSVLIDTGLPMRGKSILGKIEALGIKLKHILLTHYDVGHVGNAALLQKYTGAKVWASEEDIPYILGERDRHGLKKYLKYVLRVSKPDWINRLPKSINGIRVIPAPGHTPGHTCFLYKDILFVGDLLKSKKGVLRAYPPARNWNNGLMMQSVQKLADYQFRWICPSHGRPIDFSPPQEPEVMIGLNSLRKR